VELTRTLTVSGTYTLWVGDNGGTDTADYVLHLQRLNGRPMPAYRLRTDRHWTIGFQAEMDVYTFTASAGDMILAGLSDNGIFFDSEIRLYTSAGSLVTSGWSSGDYVELTRTLTVSGTYTLWVGDNGGTDTADYVLHLQRLNGPANARPSPTGSSLPAHRPSRGARCIRLHGQRRGYDPRSPEQRQLFV